MFEPKIVAFQRMAESLDITGIPILVDSADYVGVEIASRALSVDLEKVTGKKSPLVYYEPNQKYEAVIILGSLQKSKMIQTLRQSGKLIADDLEGKWEAFVTGVITTPLEGIGKAFVLAGSDKRGTMFAGYTLCEQIGVSPWWWWADVPVERHDQVFALGITSRQGEPTVKFRGIFINDEAPSLTGWVIEKFGPKYNSDFYKKVYDLLLRMKANFLWPAMWPGYPQPGNSFFEDDAINHRVADDYGIVVSTSHHEPMQRAMIEWFSSEEEGSWSWIDNKDKIRDYFQKGIERAKNYESYVTLGIRGDGDREMTADDPLAVLKDVISNQREIIKDVHGDEQSVRQLWALYKEVQEYYDHGLHIADDVTLLFADDNFGTLRRLPFGKEKNRSGGAGLYYHFEYVGHPRSYKWLNSNTCGKIYQQLKLAVNHNANQIWVFNVGDIKPMEVPLTFAMSLAWDATATTIPQFWEQYALREFGLENAHEITGLLQGHDRLVAMRRHEHIEAETFSVVNYNEAQNIVKAWSDLLNRAVELDRSLAHSLKPAFFQIVLHPIKASYICTRLRVCQALNKLYGLQRRNSTNKMAQLVLKLFDEDYDLSQEYHTLLDGKWNHMMRQPHYGYGDTWHAPSRDIITGLSYVQTRQASNPIVGQMGVAVEGNAGVRPGRTNEESDRTHPSRKDLVPGVTLPSMDRYGPAKRSFELFARGPCDIHWSAEVDNPSISLSIYSGLISSDGEDQRIDIMVDWATLPTTFDSITLIHIRSADGYYEQIRLPLSGRRVPETFEGFVESDGHVSISARHFTHASADTDTYYQYNLHLGRLEDGGISLKDDEFSNEAEIPYLNYSCFLFSSVPEVTITLFFTTALDFDPSKPLVYDLAFGGQLRRGVNLLKPDSAGKGPEDWAKASQDCVWTRTHSFESVAAGACVFSYRTTVPGLNLEKIIVDLGGVRDSYLGPPESTRIAKS